MVLPVKLQTYYFCATLMSGFFIGILFDTYKVVRGEKPKKSILTNISDLLFWVFAGLLMFIYLIYSNNADLRYYTFPSMLLGVYLYQVTLSSKMVNLLRIIIYIIKKALRISCRLIGLPFNLIGYAYRLTKIKIGTYFIKYIINTFKKSKKKL